MPEYLQVGSSGPAVLKLQHALNARPYINIVEDGRFGPMTEEAVRRFQLRVRAVPDGIAGPITQDRLWLRALFADVVMSAPLTLPTGPNAFGRSVPGVRQAAAPAPVPAVPTSGAGIVQQVTVGGQTTLAPWLVRPTLPPGTPIGPIWSGLVSYALVYRTAKDGPHVELALNPQFLVNSRVQTTDPRWTLQLNGQVTFADLVAPGRFHLISPFIQGTWALNLGPGSSFGAGFAIGNQVSFDLIPDRMQIVLQANVGAQWSNIGRPDATFSVVGQGALGATVQF